MCTTGRWVVVVGPKVIGTMSHGGCFGRASAFPCLAKRKE